MSQQHVELVRRIYSDGLFDRDPDRNVHEFASPDVEYINPPEAVEPGISRGRAQVAQALRSSSELFDSRRHEAQGCSTAGTPSWPPSAVAPVLLGAGPNSSRRRPIPGPSATGGLRALSGGARLASALEAVRLRGEAMSLVVPRPALRYATLGLQSLTFSFSRYGVAVGRAGGGDGACARHAQGRPCPRADPPAGGTALRGVGRFVEAAHD
jgi:hypothetical protein